MRKQKVNIEEYLKEKHKEGGEIRQKDLLEKLGIDGYKKYQMERGKEKQQKLKEELGEEAYSERQREIAKKRWNKESLPVELDTGEDLNKFAPGKLKDLEPEIIRKEYWNKGKAVKEISLDYKVSPTSIHNYMVVNKIPRRPRGMKGTYKPETNSVVISDPIINEQYNIKEYKKVDTTIVETKNLEQDDVGVKATLSKINWGEELDNLTKEIKEKYISPLATTTRGKTMEKLEIIAEVKALELMHTITNKLNELQIKVDKLQTELDLNSKNIVKGEELIRTPNVLNKIKKDIEKKKIELLVLQNQEIIEEKESINVQITKYELAKKFAGHQLDFNEYIGLLDDMSLNEIKKFMKDFNVEYKIVIEEFIKEK